MKRRPVYHYRVEFEPQLESKYMRKLFFRIGTTDIFSKMTKMTSLDGGYDVFSSQKLEQEVTATMEMENKCEPGQVVKMTITNIREIAGSAAPAQLAHERA